ncbi:DUF5993 family protein [Paraphotobacterium marinum]|uniref:DUF5993 family protein n=1 Tax=Paraphotobacterium marinum TaxID=1755811 RepID=UPI001CEF9D54|nr:DUF5993 family protein [Paraphotobacterium marinum]
MISLIFFLLFLSFLFSYLNRKRMGYVVFSISFIISCFWLNHHATDTLSILL